MKEELLGEFVKDYIRKNREYDFDLWLGDLDVRSNWLSYGLGEGEHSKADILGQVVSLLYCQIGFNLTVAGPHQLGLIDDDYQKEMEAAIEESDEIYQRALQILGENVDLFDAFKRCHNERMGFKEASYGDLV